MKISDDSLLISSEKESVKNVQEMVQLSCQKDEPNSCERRSSADSPLSNVKNPQQVKHSPALQPIVNAVDTQEVAGKIDSQKVANKVDSFQVANNVELEEVTNEIDVQAVADKIDPHKVADIDSQTILDEVEHEFVCEKVEHFEEIPQKITKEQKIDFDGKGSCVYINWCLPLQPF